jgi:hypothetical protein
MTQPKSYPTCCQKSVALVRVQDTVQFRFKFPAFAIFVMLLFGVEKSRAEEAGSFCRMIRPQWAACQISVVPEFTPCTCTDAVGVEHAGTAGIPSDSVIYQLSPAQVLAGDFVVFGIPPLLGGAFVIAPRDPSAARDATLRSLLSSLSLQNLQPLTPFPPVTRPTRPTAR